MSSRPWSEANSKDDLIYDDALTEILKPERQPDAPDKDKLRASFVTAPDAADKGILGTKITRGILALFIIIGLVALGLTLTGSEQVPSDSCFCGETTAEAQEIYGCQFDILAAAWLPPHCRNDSLTEAFRNAGPKGGWRYFADREWQHEISEEHVSLMANNQRVRFHASWDWHMLHCLFNWQKQVYAWEAPESLTMDARYATLRHAHHCTEMFIGHQNTSSGIALDSSDIHRYKAKHSS